MSRRQSASLGLISPRLRANDTVDHDSIYSSTGRIHQDVPPQQPPPPPLKHIIGNSASGTQPQEKRICSTRTSMAPVTTEWQDSELERQYDLTPLADKAGSTRRRTPSYTIDPFEFSPCSTPVNDRTTAYVTRTRDAPFQNGIYRLHLILTACLFS